jgi:hypothetical protein
VAYATVRDLRREGVTARASRIRPLLDEATAYVDKACGWFFEPRELFLSVAGRGVPTIEPPVPPIWIDRIEAGGVELDDSEVFVIGAPVNPGFEAPSITRRAGVFPKGNGSVLIEGTFGYTEIDGTDDGRTPLSIRRATMLLVLRWLDPLASAGAEDARVRARVIEEKTRDQSYKLAPEQAMSSGLTGDPEIDDILLRYRRPAEMGAA